MACGRPFNGEHIVEGTPLVCGTKLWWKTPDAKRPQDRVVEVLTCPACAKENL
jgi:hypothetical protein